MESTDKERIELLVLRYITMYLLARVNATHREPLTPVWTQWLAPAMDSAVSRDPAPQVQAFRAEAERFALELLAQAEKLAKSEWGQDRPPH